jgi:hypothetical protein
LPIPASPPLNGRNLAEFYVAGEAAKLSTLREYAKPVEEQQARIIMYEPIRRVVRDYFQSGRDADVLERITRNLESRHFDNADYDAIWHRSNATAIRNLRAIPIKGEFRDFSVLKTNITVSGVRVLSTVDFYATYVPKASNGTTRRFGVIVNPSGIKKAAEKRKQWIRIESELAYRSAVGAAQNIDGIMYLDLAKQDVTLHLGPKKPIWSEIEATCYRLLRDWRELRAAGIRHDETGTG